MKVPRPRRSRLSGLLYGGFGLGASMLLALIALANLATLLHRGGNEQDPALAEGPAATDDLYVGSIQEAGFLAARTQAAEEA